jgi:hypothetical protein
MLTSKPLAFGATRQRAGCRGLDSRPTAGVTRPPTQRRRPTANLAAVFEFHEPRPRYQTEGPQNPESGLEDRPGHCNDCRRRQSQRCPCPKCLRKRPIIPNSSSPRLPRAPKSLQGGAEAGGFAAFSTVPSEVLFGILEAHRRKAILPGLANSSDDPYSKRGGCRTEPHA